MHLILRQAALPFCLRGLDWRQIWPHRAITQVDGPYRECAHEPDFVAPMVNLAMLDLYLWIESVLSGWRSV